MPYQIGGAEFRTKSAITYKCRLILSEIPDGTTATEEQCEFLLALFRNHDEWKEKSEGGIKGISTQMTEHGTRCFVLVRKNDSRIDISFTHSIKLIPSKRASTLVSQRLLDYKAAARTAIKSQIQAFRNVALVNGVVCPYTGKLLDRSNCAIDHMPPITFDKLLFNFSVTEKITPETVEVSSENGVVAEFIDNQIKERWQRYHQTHAQLRAISRIGNLQLPKEPVPWNELR